MCCSVFRCGDKVRFKEDTWRPWAKDRVLTVVGVRFDHEADELITLAEDPDIGMSEWLARNLVRSEYRG